MSVMSASLRRQLQIVPLDESPKKSVHFADLNPVKTFNFNEPPALLHEHNEVARLKLHIRLLEQSLDQYESPPPTPSVQSALSRTPSLSSIQLPQNPVEPAPQRLTLAQQTAAIRLPIPPQRPVETTPTVRRAQARQEISATRKFFAKIALAVSVIGVLGVPASIAACFIVPPIGVAALLASVCIAIGGAAIYGTLMDRPR